MIKPLDYFYYPWVYGGSNCRCVCHCDDNKDSWIPLGNFSSSTCTDDICVGGCRNNGNASHTCMTFGGEILNQLPIFGAVELGIAVLGGIVLIGSYLYHRRPTNNSVSL